jgi:hypothetical protein
MLSCNSCQNAIEGISYRTTCRHLYCPGCAKETFGTGHTCSICDTVLSHGDVCEIVTGINIQSTLLDKLFQLALQDTNWNNILDNVHRMSLAMADLSLFLSSQLCLRNEQEEHDKTNLRKDYDTLENKLVRQL